MGEITAQRVTVINQSYKEMVLVCVGGKEFPAIIHSALNRINLYRAFPVDMLPEVAEGFRSAFKEMSELLGQSVVVCLQNEKRYSAIAFYAEIDGVEYVDIPGDGTMVRVSLISTGSEIPNREEAANALDAVFALADLFDGRFTAVNFRETGTGYDLNVSAKGGMACVGMHLDWELLDHLHKYPHDAQRIADGMASRLGAAHFVGGTIKNATYYVHSRQRPEADNHRGFDKHYQFPAEN